MLQLRRWTENQWVQPHDTHNDTRSNCARVHTSAYAVRVSACRERILSESKVYKVHWRTFSNTSLWNIEGFVPTRLPAYHRLQSSRIHVPSAAGRGSVSHTNSTIPLCLLQGSTFNLWNANESFTALCVLCGGAGINNECGNGIMRTKRNIHDRFCRHEMASATHGEHSKYGDTACWTMCELGGLRGQQDIWTVFQR